MAPPPRVVCQSRMSQLVSIIMPCFNAGRMLRPALLSVLRQTHPRIEIVFIDNASTDDSAAVARRILATAGRPFTLLTCSTPGANNARNLGYTAAHGDFIQWMDADDQMGREKIALQVAALDASPRDDVAYGDWVEHRIAPGKPEIVDRNSLRQDDDQVARTLAGVWYPPHLYLLRRSAADRLQKHQAWSPDRMVATDVEYSAIAALLGMRFRHVPGAEVRYNIWSDTQISGATPYPKRVAALRAIFERLKRFVDSGEVQAILSARHKTLLNQGWDIWRMPAGSVTVTQQSGRRLVAHRARDGHQIELRPREALIVRRMNGAAALLTMHHALGLAGLLPELANDHVTIIRTLEMLQREGMLERVA
jgi:hypothetical protein